MLDCAKIPDSKHILVHWLDKVSTSLTVCHCWSTLAQPRLLYYIQGLTMLTRSWMRKRTKLAGMKDMAKITQMDTTTSVELDALEMRQCTY